MRRGPARFFAIGLAVIFVSFISGCATIFSATLYDRLTLVAPDCGGGYSGATPASFRAWVDSTPYLMPDYQDVRFPSRDPAITIDAWWIPGPTADTPAVVLAHGLHECKPWARTTAGVSAVGPGIHHATMVKAGSRLGNRTSW